MAKEEVVMEIKAEINPAKKQVEEFTKTLNDAEKAQKELNEQISIQNKVLNDLEKELVELKAVQDSIPKGAFYAGMSDLNAKIKETEKNIKLEKLGLKDLQNQQKENNRELKEQNKELKENEKLVKEGIGNFRLFGVSINDVNKSIGRVIPTIKVMFATIARGIMSTGIGALLIAFGSLATYFTSTQRGADKLKIALTGISAAFNVIRDRISTVGEAISLVFSGKFSEAADKLKGSFKGITDEIKEEIKVMTDLEKRQQALRDAEIQFTVQRAKTRKEIEAARLLAEDETKSQEERIDALQKALDLETKTTNQELELARERVRIQEEQMKISENLVEDEKKLADFRADVLAKETKSLRLQKRVKTEINELNREIEAEEKRIAKEKQDREDAEFEAMIKANDEWNKQQLKDAEIQAQKELEIQKATEDAKKNLISQGFDIAGELAGESDKAQKAVAVAKTIYNTQQAIMNAMANIPAPFNIATAVSTGIMGAMSVKNILSTNPRNASNVSLPTAPSSGTPAPEMLSGRFQLGGVEEQQPVQAYVVTDSLTDNQNKLAYIRRRATI
tara:strand:- start:3954 stop:5645 length:1692 start_codon:yes stop_codon:yes gene_type:complete